MRRASLLLGLGASCLIASTGCAALRTLGGTNTVDLDNAQVLEMGVDIRKEQKTLCPGESVQMAVFAKIQQPGEPQPLAVETWAGSGDVNRNGKLDFAEFAFQSPHGHFDQNGWYSPSGDPLLTVGTEFQITTSFRRQPDRFTFTTTYKPDYWCFRQAGADGTSGSDGPDGASGQHGNKGDFSPSDRPGLPGTDGTAGGDGGPGAAGSQGGTLTVHATYVSTPFYDKLVALIVEGSASGFVLFHTETEFYLSARGGAGGRGGRGGPGGRGGDGGSGGPGGNGANGGNGGNGANGAPGGNGGSITLVYDARFPELAQLVHLDVSGGSGGAAGPAGMGGSAGKGGSAAGPDAGSGTDGTSGTHGQSGQPGPSGADGTATEVAGEVVSRFAALPVTVLP